MKELTLYQCEICGTKYAHEQPAIVCEESHKIPTEVVAIKYRTVKDNKSGYPDYVNVTFSDGSIERYKHE